MSGKATDVTPATRFAWVEDFPLRGPGARDALYRLSKRLFDLAVVLVSVPVWLPLFAACYALVKWESPRAPAFFVQVRTGRLGHRFHLPKFRTMVENASDRVASLAAQNVRQGTDFKVHDDPRVTSVGRLLRRPHLDELPQLWNVLRGEMSLVGPRPTSLPPNAYRLWHTERFDIVPGLTCIWQLEEDTFPAFDDRIRLDILYARHACLALDTKIMVLTVIYILKGGRGV